MTHGPVFGVQWAVGSDELGNRKVQMWLCFMNELSVKGVTGHRSRLIQLRQGILGGCFRA